jgi:hypothetical protein
MKKQVSPANLRERSIRRPTLPEEVVLHLESGSTGHSQIYRLSDAERAAVREGIDAAAMGHFAPEDEMEEFYRLHRGA